MNIYAYFCTSLYKCTNYLNAESAHFNLVPSLPFITFVILIAFNYQKWCTISTTYQLQTSKQANKQLSMVVMTMKGTSLTLDKEIDRE